MSLRLDWCSYRAARYACSRWHYSGSIPTPPLVRIGVWEHERFIGCVLFSRGAAPQLGVPYGAARTEVCELTRIALDAHETPVTRIVKIAIIMLRRHSPGLRLIVSFADPNQGHVGAIYQAGGWLYVGSTSPVPRYRDKTGRLWHSRQISTSGLKRQYGTVRRVVPIGECERIDELGRYRYLYPLDRAMRERVEPLRKAHPRVGSIGGDAPVTSQTGEGGSTPTPTLDDLAAQIRAALTDDLLKPEYRNGARPYAGHCYVASEAYFHLAGGASAGLRVAGVRHEGTQHWWIVGADGRVVDLTAEQFVTPVPYARGRGRSFRTPQPSKRARVVIERVSRSACDRARDTP